MPRVLAIGNCGFDESTIRSWLRKHFSADMTPADDLHEALAHLERESFELVLVNRVLDRDGSSGLEIIRSLHADERFAAIPLMLVSNYPEAQAEAIAAGAEPGFGKNELHSDAVIERTAKFFATSEA